MIIINEQINVAVNTNHCCIWHCLAAVWYASFD